MPRRRRACVDQIGMVFFIPGMQLQQQSTGERNAIVDVAVGVFRPDSAPSNAAYQRLLARTSRTAMSGCAATTGLVG